MHFFYTGINQELFSNANCALTDDPFQFDLWTITKSTPGEGNKCIGGVDDERIEPCDASIIPIDSDVIFDNVQETSDNNMQETPDSNMQENSDNNMQETSDNNMQETLDNNAQETSESDIEMQLIEDSECAAKIGDQISSIHQQELRSVYSRELKVSGNDERVTGTYTISDEILGYPFKEVWKRETDSDNVASVDTFYIFYLPDAFGWRVGNKQSYWQSGLDPQGYYYSSKFKIIYSKHVSNHGLISFQYRRFYFAFENNFIMPKLA